MNKNYNIEIVDDITVVRFIDKPKPDDIRMSIDEVATISLSGLRLLAIIMTRVMFDSEPEVVYADARSSTEFSPMHQKRRAL
jgi:hypothetical protein